MYINIHGGGFIKGMRDQDYVFCRNICSRAGVAVADIDYVPAPHMRYPGQVYACYDVLQYFAQNTAKWNLDREKIAVGGHSAGGNLAAAIILMAIHENAFVPALQILDYPGLELHIPAGKRETETAIHEFLPGKQIFIIKCMQILNLDRRSIAVPSLHRIHFWHKCRQH